MRNFLLLKKNSDIFNNYISRKKRNISIGLATLNFLKDHYFQNFPVQHISEIKITKSNKKFGSFINQPFLQKSTIYIHESLCFNIGKYIKNPEEVSFPFNSFKVFIHELFHSRNHINFSTFIEEALTETNTYLFIDKFIKDIFGDVSTPNVERKRLSYIPYINKLLTLFSVFGLSEEKTFEVIIDLKTFNRFSNNEFDFNEKYLSYVRIEGIIDFILFLDKYYSTNIAYKLFNKYTSDYSYGSISSVIFTKKYIETNPVLNTLSLYILKNDAYYHTHLSYRSEDYDKDNLNDFCNNVDPEKVFLLKTIHKYSI